MPRRKGQAAEYDSFYFSRFCDLQQTEAYARTPFWLEFNARIADRIVRDIGPRSVLDAGCAMGFLVEALRDRGVDAVGIDVSEYALSQVRDDVKPYCRQASVTEPLDRDYDLIVCIEVLEHLQKREAEQAIENFAAHTGDLIFSSTPQDFKEATHFNVQPAEYWSEQFARLGLLRDLDYDASTFISPWAVRFTRSSEPLPRVVGRYERSLARREQESLALREVAIDARRIAERAERAEAELAAIKASATYRLAQRLAALKRATAPRDSRRGRLLERLAARETETR